MASPGRNLVQQSIPYLLFTVEEQEKYLNRFYTQNETPAGRARLKEMARLNQFAVQRFLARYQGKISPADSPSLERLKLDFDPEIITNEAKYRFYDPAVMKIVEKVYDSFAHPRRYGESSPGEKFSLNYWLKDNNKIGSESAYASVYQPGFERRRPYEPPYQRGPFVFKVAQDPADDVRTEWAIGLKLNELRDEIPNFVYTYGAFNCGRPLPFSDEASTCSSAGEIPHLIIESVFPSMSLDDYLKSDPPLEDIFSVMMQVLMALKMAYDRFYFFHNDLHRNNILIRTLDETRQIKYTIGKLDFYVKANVVATIIDYGFASAKIDDSMVGFVDPANVLGIQSGKLLPYPFYDIFMLLFGVTIALTNIRYEPNTQAEADRRKLAEILRLGIIGFGHIDDKLRFPPPTQVRKNLNHSDYIEYIATHLPELYNSIVRFGVAWDEIPLAGCSPCRSVEETASVMLTQSLENISPTPESVFLLYETVMYQRYRGETLAISFDQVTSVFRGEALYFHELCRKIAAELNEGVIRFRDLFEKDILKFEGSKYLVQIGDWPDQDQYLQFLDQALKVDQRLSYMAKTVAMAYCVAHVYGDFPEHLDLANAMRHSYNRIVSNKTTITILKTASDTAPYVKNVDRDDYHYTADIKFVKRHRLPANLEC